MSDGFVRMVERAHSLDRSPSEWLDALAGLLRSEVSHSASAFAFEIARVAGRFAMRDHWVEASEVSGALQRSFAEVPAAVLEHLFCEPLVAETSRSFLARRGVSFPEQTLGASFAAVGARDVFTLGGFDPDGNGVALGVLLREGDGPSDAERTAWSQVAAHVAAGFRLRSRIGEDSPVDHAGAVLRTDGTIEHLATGTMTDLREVFRDAVARVERARVSHDRDEALGLWQTLIAGEWSLAEHFEAGGRRYYVAVRNPPEGARAKALTTREAEVVAYIASGTGTKATAYALGVDEATVRRYLHNGMVKLGIDNRAELITLRSILLS